MIKFRNYTPSDEACIKCFFRMIKFNGSGLDLPISSLAEGRMPAAVASEFDAPLQAPDAPEDLRPGADVAEAPLETLAPPKANWDLRRDVAAKLAKLEKRTQRAMVTLMKTEQDGR